MVLDTCSFANRKFFDEHYSDVCYFQTIYAASIWSFAK